MIEMEDGQRLVGNFYYSIKPEISEDPVADGESITSGVSTADYDKFDSQCGKTMVGFV